MHGFTALQAATRQAGLCNSSSGPQGRWSFLSAFMTITNFPARQQTLADRLTLEQIRHRLYQVLSDCKDMSAQRAIYRINVAATPLDLWQLRSDLHQCIARVHDQAEASRRINALLDAFDGWVPSSQLTRIPESLRDTA
jgi:alpha-L-arabinofuranosidase